MKNIALHILDLVQNSARAKAGKVQISIKEDPGKDRYLLSIEDDGEGMDAYWITAYLILAGLVIIQSLPFLPTATSLSG